MDSEAEEIDEDSEHETPPAEAESNADNIDNSVIIGILVIPARKLDTIMSTIFTLHKGWLKEFPLNV